LCPLKDVFRQSVSEHSFGFHNLRLHRFSNRIPILKAGINPFHCWANFSSYVFPCAVLTEPILAAASGSRWFSVMQWMDPFESLDGIDVFVHSAHLAVRAFISYQWVYITLCNKSLCGLHSMHLSIYPYSHNSGSVPLLFHRDHQLSGVVAVNARLGCHHARPWLRPLLESCDSGRWGENGQHA